MGTGSAQCNGLGLISNSTNKPYPTLGHVKQTITGLQFSFAIAFQ